jgi:conjugal transfer/entry exclusion protein
LVTMKAKLDLEVKKEIKNKMSNIQKLIDEISNMKFSCDEVSKLLQSSKKKEKD